MDLVRTGIVIRLDESGHHQSRITVSDCDNYSTYIWYKRWRLLFQVQRFPVDDLEPWMSLQLGKAFAVWLAS